MPVLQRLGERFWFVPALLCLAAVLTSELLIWVDRTWQMSLPDWATMPARRICPMWKRRTISTGR